jgi:PAS domain S-box-containing protein
MKPSTTSLATEEALRLALFVSSVTDYAIYMLTPEGRVASWNAGAQRFKGYTADEIIGEHFSRFYTGEDKAVGLPHTALRMARETGKFEAEGWRVRKDGSRFWASVIIDPIWNDDTQLVGFAKITRDITQKKVDEEKLRESENRFRLLVQGVTDYALYMLSPTGEITNWNSGACRIKGYEVDEVLGTNFSRFYTDEDRANGVPQRALEQARLDGRFEHEGWRVRKDGSRFWAHVVIDAVRNEMGQLVGFAKITRDISERKKAEAELVAAREALFQSQKLEALGKLTGGVAHDFNNLLNVVGNAVAVLRRKSVDPVDLRLMDTIDQAIRRGAGLTQQLLTFARQQPLSKERRHLNRIISSFEAVLQRAGRHGVQLAFALGEELPLVEVDASQLETGLLNLVVNAYDATPPGGTVTVSTRAVELAAGELKSLPAGRYVVLTVSDTGQGMAPDVAQRAIEPFFTTKEIGKGTGLGLSQVYGMVQQSGGDIVIRSTQGAGSDISLYFPAVVGGDACADESGAEELETVLVVDDQPDVLEVTAELFRSLGFDVLCANSGEEALQTLGRAKQVSLLFSDVVMPGMNGPELARQATALAPGLKVILASGYIGRGGQGAGGGELDGFPFLAKPYRVNDVVRKLRAIG